MGVMFKKNVAVFQDTVGVESAEELLTWMRSHPKGKADLRSCTHIHAAHLQLLMAAKTQVSAWPDDTVLTSWLTIALRPT
jgi:hypothetical protein